MDIRLSGSVQFRAPQERKTALSLIQRLIVASGVGIADTSAATLEVLTGGRSAAQVFKLTPLFGAARSGSRKPVKGTPVVVKIAARAEALREKANYEKFVRAGVPADCRPALLGFAAARGRGALCYSFVGGRDGARLETLTDYLQRGDGAVLNRVLRRIFAPLRDTWCSPQSIRRERDIARYYLERYFAGKRGAAKDEAILAACAARYFKAKKQDGGYRIGDHWFPSPYAVLFEAGAGRARAKRAYRSCILHGDLNTDNIVVAERRSEDNAAKRRSGNHGAPDTRGVALIDFLKTGRGHVYQDLVSLEASVRINHPKDAAYGEIVETERLIARGKRPPGDNPYAAMIRKIRAAASCSFGTVEEAANYHFAVAAVALRLMQATDLTPIARARITMSALWAAKMLSEGEPAVSRAAKIPVRAVGCRR